MTHPAPLKTVAAFLNAMAVKDYEAGLALLADDCEYTNVPMSTVRGPAGVRALLEPFFAPTISNELTIQRHATEGATVFVDRLDRHQLGPDRWAELPVTGVFEVHGGRITLWRDNFDLATLLRQWPELQAALA